MDGLGDKTVHYIAFDKKGNCWVGHSVDGVSMFDGKKWHHFLNGSWIRGLVVDSKDTVWIGSSGPGIRKFNGTDWISVSKESKEKDEPTL